MASLVSRPAPDGDTIGDQTIPAGAAVLSIDNTPVGYATAPGAVHLFTGDAAPPDLLPAAFSPTAAGTFPVADDTATALVEAEGERPVAAPPDGTGTPPDTTTPPPPDTGTTPPETGGTGTVPTPDADFVVDARTLASDIAAHAPAPTLIADISSLFAHMLSAFTGALADIVSAGAGTPATGGSTPPDTVPPVVAPPTVDPGTATGGDPSTVPPSSGAGCWASQHPTAGMIPATDHTANV